MSLQTSFSKAFTGASALAIAWTVIGMEADRKVLREVLIDETPDFAAAVRAKVRTRQCGALEGLQAASCLEAREALDNLEAGNLGESTWKHLKFLLK